MAVQGDPNRDWGGLPAAIAASKCAAVNQQLVTAGDAEAVLDLVQQHRSQFNAVNVATALHRVAYHLKRSRAQRDRVVRDERFTRLVDDAIERASQCNPRSVSDIIWACATLKHWPPAMLKPLLTQMAVHLRDSAFEAQHLSLIVWALAVLECKPVVLLEQIEQNTIRQLRDFNQQNCANILWGFAKLNYQPRALLPVMTARLLEDGEFLAAMKPVEVSDTAFALALLGTPREHARLMGALAELVVPDSLLPRFSSRQLVTLTWSFARLEVRPAQLDAWLQRLIDAHARQPLLAPDQRNIKVALEYFELSTEWLQPTAEPEEPNQTEQVEA